MVDIGPPTYQSVFSGKIREAYVFICNNLLPLERVVKWLTLSLFIYWIYLYPKGKKHGEAYHRI